MIFIVPVHLACSLYPGELRISSAAFLANIAAPSLERPETLIPLVWSAYQRGIIVELLLTVWCDLSLSLTLPRSLPFLSLAFSLFSLTFPFIVTCLLHFLHLVSTFKCQYLFFGRSGSELSIFLFILLHLTSFLPHLNGNR